MDNDTSRQYSARAAKTNMETPQPQQSSRQQFDQMAEAAIEQEIPAAAAVVQSPLPPSDIVIPPSTPMTTQGAPTTVYSDNSRKVSRTNTQLFPVYGIVIVTAIPFLLAIIYFFVLPPIWSSRYLSVINPVYQTQRSDMVAVYKTINDSVFTTTQPSLSTYDRELSNIGSLVQIASKDTATLKEQNHLKVLPGTVWMSKVSKANNTYQAMQQYVANSEQLLSNYQTGINYLEQIQQIYKTQLPIINNDFNAFENGNTNDSALAAETQTASNDLQRFTDKVQALVPSTDLKQYNDDLLSDLQSLSNSLQAVSSAIEGNAAVDIDSAFGELNTSDQDLQNIVATNAATYIQMDSSIQAQIASLKNENPLQ